MLTKHSLEIVCCAFLEDLGKFLVSGPVFFADTWLKWYHCAMAKLESDPLVKKHEKGSLSHWKWVENGLLNIHPTNHSVSSPRWRTYGTSFSTTSFLVGNHQPDCEQCFITRAIDFFENATSTFRIRVLHSPLAISDVFCVVKNHLVIIIGFWFPNPERYKMLEITQTHFGKRSIPKTDLSYQSIFWSHRAWFTWARCKCSGKNPGHEKIHRFLGRPTKRSASPNEPMKYEVDVRS